MVSNKTAEPHTAKAADLMTHKCNTIQHGHVLNAKHLSDKPGRQRHRRKPQQSECHGKDQNSGFGHGKIKNAANTTARKNITPPAMFFTEPPAQRTGNQCTENIGKSDERQAAAAMAGENP